MSSELDGFIPWPEELAARYRAAGYWQGETLGAALRRWAREHRDRIALQDDEVALTYAELDRRADVLAGRLAERGLAAGDRVVVQLPNGVPFVVLLFALLRLGALPVLALPPHRQHEIGHLVRFSGAKGYAIGGRHRGFDYRDLARAVLPDAPDLDLVLVSGGEPEEFVDLDTLAADGRVRTPPTPGPAPEDVALFLLSGGTTGLPKLIPRTHDDYRYNAVASADVCGLGPRDVYLVALPIGHNFPLACPGVLGTLSAGGRVVVTAETDPGEVLRVIERQRVSVTAVVPALAIRWMDHLRSVGAEAPDVGSLRLLQVGGARLPEEAARRVRPELGATLQQVFGMAEGLLNYTRLDDAEEVCVATQGRPLSPADEVRVVDASGMPLPDGQPGVLETRGPYTLRGYWCVPEVNARSFTDDGFYRTGDVVVRRPDGNLVVQGREKDLINRGGEKVSAEEVENLVLAHPAVAAVAVVAMPDPVLGERACAFVVTRPAARLDLAELTDHLRARGLAAFKLPERLELTDELPLTNVGKVDKAALRRTATDRTQEAPA